MREQIKINRFVSAFALKCNIPASPAGLNIDWLINWLKLNVIRILFEGQVGKVAVEVSNDG